ncbi:MAG TPA: glycosyltransferase family 39 protein, partial [Vicinamibacteria bacterium]|nr:glycosyltransferase family 39 protein [Vicinamibacteria bacterium]
MEAGGDQDAGRPALALAVVGGLAAAKLALHLALSARYGYFRDELYFLDCGRHLGWGYVDHAPLIGLLARVALALGAALPVLRAFPALAGAGTVFLSGALAWRLGGGRFAQGLAALAVLVMPIRLGIDSLFSMNAFEPLFWMGAVYVLVRLIQTADPRRWVLLGLLLGAGLMNKHSTAFFALALAAGVLLTPLRAHLRTRWPWLGALAAVMVFAPNIAWQVRHDFATLEDLRNVARTGKNVVLGPVAFVAQQVLITHPVLVPLWLAGLVWLFRAHGGRYRALAWMAVLFFALMFVMKAKNYYLAPIYPVVLAAGAVACERMLERWPVTRARLWPRLAVAALVLAA